jgi:hypothetical protein
MGERLGRYKAESDTKPRRTALAAYFRTATFILEKAYRARNRKFETVFLQRRVSANLIADLIGLGVTSNRLYGLLSSEGSSIVPCTFSVFAPTGIPEVLNSK